MLLRLLVCLLCVVCAGRAQEVRLGEEPRMAGVVDGWSAILSIDESDTYTNTSGGPQTITITDWSVAIGAPRGRVTPFIARVNADNAFTVLAIGTTRSAGADYTATGVKTFAFSADATTFSLAAGQKIAAGFTDANPDGSGNAGSVVPFVDGGDEIWLTGGPAASNAGSIVPGQSPRAGPGGTTLTNLSRQYQVGIGISIFTGPAAPIGVELAQLDIFPTSSAGTNVGTLTSQDANQGDTFTYSLVTNPDGLFLIGGDRLTLAASPGVVGTSRTVRIRTTDQTARFFEKNFVITVAEPMAPTAIACTAELIFTGTSVGATLGRFTASDPNTSDEHTFALVAGAGDADNALFTILGAELRLAQALPAGKTSATFRVRATDRAGLEVEGAFTLPIVEPGVRLNEFVANNDTGPKDADGAQSDWIELHNPRDVAVDLAGWRLTDDPARPALWTFPAVGIPAGGYLVVFASGKNRAVAGQELHTNFSLDAAGETLTLSKPDGALADTYSPREQANNIAFGYGSNGGRGYLAPTPNAPNGPAFAYGISKVEFSVPRGFYSAAQSLALTSNIPGSLIRYTLNGTKPSATNGTSYTGPIAITPETAGATRGTRRVRAVALNVNAAATRVVTHTYLFVNGVAAPATDGLVAQTNSNNAAQTNAIRTRPAYAALLDDALLDLPAIVITNPSGLPTTSESETSVELISPTGVEPGFHINCGIQAVGNASLASPKNNFRLYFRSEYGEPKLKYPVFAGHPYDIEGATTSFDRLNIRSGSHDSFHWLADPSLPPPPGTPADALYLRNIVMDDLQFRMGKISTHGRFVNCFVNGQYHGLYHVREYPNDDFIASHLPGPPSQFEFTNGANPAENGSANWQATWSKIKTYATTAGPANYTQLQRWLDVRDLADFVVLNFWAGNNWDWNPNQNWIAAGPNVPDAGGWRFFSYDNDIIWMSQNTNVTDRNVPDGWFNTLMSLHPDFQVLFRDRLYKHCFHGGALTDAQARATLEFREAQITKAIVAETARWQPGAATSLPWDRDGEWAAELARLKNVYFPNRCGILLGQVRARGWYPLDAPEFSQHGGQVASGYQPTISGSAGATIYYTLDGIDPRVSGGAVNAAAAIFTTGAITVNGPMRIRTRAKNAANWSPINDVTFTLTGTEPASAANIVVSEIHYHPAADGEEFIELMNIGANHTDLSGAAFSNGIDYTFPPATVLAPGARIVVTQAQFLNGSRLADSGERIRLVAADMTTVIRDFSYGDSALWPAEADGLGPSLTLIAPGKNPDHSLPENWRASGAAPTPGGSDAISFAAWKIANSISTSIDDRDRDGLDARLEYALGGNPDTDSSALLPALVRNADGTMTFTVHRALLADDAELTIETSLDLATWQPAVAPLTSRSVAGAIETRTYTVAAEPGTRQSFLRARFAVP